MTKNLLVTTLLLIVYFKTNWVNANSLTDAITTFSLSESQLHELSNKHLLAHYTKVTLPVQCANIKLPTIQEQYLQQPPSNIVGSWYYQAKPSLSKRKANLSMTRPKMSGYVTIDRLGFIAFFSANHKKASCSLINLNELNGNQLIQPITKSHQTTFNINLDAIKLTRIKDKLASIAIFHEIWGIETTTNKNSFSELVLYEQYGHLPQACDIQSHLPTTEMYDNNPSSTLLGTWSTSKLSRNNINSNVTKRQITPLLIVTPSGHLLNARYYNRNGIENCLVDYIGETSGNLYQKN